MSLVALAVLAATRLEAGGGPKKSRGDRIMVKPKAGMPPGQLRSFEAHLGCHVLRELPRLAGWQVVQIPAKASVPDMVAAFQASGLVDGVEPDYIIHLAEVADSPVPNDPNFLNGNQWNLYNFGQSGITPGIDIDATNGWAIQNSASNIIVAVIDTGIRYTHEDLAPNLWVNPQVNEDGYSNDIHGINLVANGRGNGDPWDDYGHGSHVAGIIGAKGNNGLGIAGICWNVQLMALKFIDTNGDGAVSDAVTCMDFAASHGARVINASWGAYWFGSQALWDAVNSLRDKQIIFVAAAGNSTNSNDGPLAVFPATYSRSLDNVIAVAASDVNDQLASFSNFGRNSVQLLAPGDPVFSCWNGSDNDYRWNYGTSMAAPHVAATCALIWAKYPNLSAVQVIRQVVNGVDVLPSLADDCMTSGRLNLHKALVPESLSTEPPTNVWFDDAVPTDAQLGPPNTNYFNDGSIKSIAEGWLWVNGNPGPVSGSAAHQSPLTAGIHSHSFSNSTAIMDIRSGDKLFSYVYLDPANPPREIMLEWSDNCWEHRAFWGEDNIPNGVANTSGRVNMGPLPPAGQWVRLEVPANVLKLEGAKVNGMGFVLYDGAATWDYSGQESEQGPDTTPPVVALSAPPNNKTVSGIFILDADASDDQSGVQSVQFQLDGVNLGAAVVTPPYQFNWDTKTVANGVHTLAAVARDNAGNVAQSAPVSVMVSNSTQPGVDFVWMDDAVPAGATTSENIADSWHWTNSDPTPFSGTLEHQSCIAPGLHYHYFYDSAQTMSLGAGDVIFAYVYLDPENPPSEVMMQWKDANSWSHAAYWGGPNLIAWGVDGTESQYAVGRLPEAGQWVRLEVPARAVGLEGSVVTGMYFTLYDGRATWDTTGKRSAQ